jgi:penicillin V acylase-like amidase (Ntn superfamily)
MRLTFVITIALLTISLAVLLPVRHAEACSRIFWNSNGRATVARNMDLNFNDLPCLFAMPARIEKTGNGNFPLKMENPATWTSKYGSVITAFWGYSLGSDICTEGLNTQGLAFHLLYLDGSKYEERDSRPGVYGGIYGQYLLDNAATVTEALDLMRTTQIVPNPGVEYFLPCHLALEDATGDSAIVEFIGGKMMVYHGPEYTVLTNEPPYNEQLDNLKKYKNFDGNLPWPGDVDPTSRFVRASAFLSTLNSQPFLQPNPLSCLFSAIRGVATPFGAQMPDDEGDAWPTLWSSVFDLTNRVIYVTHIIAKNNFRIDMRKINFAQGAPVLFLEAYDPGLFGEVSGKMEPDPETK